MSEQRRLRSELRQGLHQFMMSLYHSYSQSLSHENAVEQIGECLKEEYEYFTKQQLNASKTNSLEITIESLETLARKEKNSVKQHELYEELEAVVNAQEILAKYQTEGVK